VTESEPSRSGDLRGPRSRVVAAWHVADQFGSGRVIRVCAYVDNPLAIGAPLALFIMGRPSRLLKVVFDAPAVLYRIGLGWMLGKRIVAVTHRGRKTGELRETVLEVLLFDPVSKESVVVSAYGTRADWYRNLRIQSALRVRTGWMDYVPEQRFLTAEETREAAIEFSRRHPWEVKLVPRVLPAIGAAVPKHSDSDPVDLLASLPMVSFRPKA
jgi:deazaflavin-dependent oxidoreductase (nitroreductase family)